MQDAAGGCARRENVLCTFSFLYKKLYFYGKTKMRCEKRGGTL